MMKGSNVNDFWDQCVSPGHGRWGLGDGLVCGRKHSLMGILSGQSTWRWGAALLGG